MKFYAVASSTIAIISAIFGAIVMGFQGQYFRSYLLILFIVMQVDLLAIRMYLERREFDPLEGLRK